LKKYISAYLLYTLLAVRAFPLLEAQNIKVYLIMNWFKIQVKKLHKKERKSFEKEQLEKLETDYKWIRGQGYDNLHDWDRDENIAFVKMLIIVFAVIVLVLLWVLLA
jgi:hypothetical protein